MKAKVNLSPEINLGLNLKYDNIVYLQFQANSEPYPKFYTSSV